MTKTSTRILRIPRPAWSVPVYAAILILPVLFFADSAAVSGSVRQALILCAENVIPALFPFMVLAELIVGSGLGEEVGRLFGGATQWLFGVPQNAACALLLGFFCGNPVGARTAVALYDRGEISRSELEHTMLLCNQTGPAFLIGMVGSSLWGERWFGLGLFCAQTISMFIVSRMFCRAGGGKTAARRVMPEPASAGLIFTRAVGASVNGMLAVCGYVIFFSVLRDAAGRILTLFSAPSFVAALFGGVLELSSGMAAAAGVGNRFLGAVIAGFIAGWGGLSVHVQIMSIAEGCEIPFRRYFAVKLLQGLCCAALTALWLTAADPLPAFPTNTAICLPVQRPYSGVLTFIFVVAAAVMLLVRLLHRLSGGTKTKKTCK